MEISRNDKSYDYTWIVNAVFFRVVASGNSLRFCPVTCTFPPKRESASDCDLRIGLTSQAINPSKFASIDLFESFLFSSVLLSFFYTHFHLRVGGIT